MAGAGGDGLTSMRGASQPCNVPIDIRARRSAPATRRVLRPAVRLLVISPCPTSPWSARDTTVTSVKTATRAPSDDDLDVSPPRASKPRGQQQAAEHGAGRRERSVEQAADEEQCDCQIPIPARRPPFPTLPGCVSRTNQIAAAATTAAATASSTGQIGSQSPLLACKKYESVSRWIIVRQSSWGDAGLSPCRQSHCRPQVERSIQPPEPARHRHRRSSAPARICLRSSTSPQ